jgi:hypothetical protein
MLLGQGVVEGAEERGNGEGKGRETDFAPQTRFVTDDFGIIVLTAIVTIATRVRAVGARETVEAGPSRLSDRPTRSSKGKGNAAEYLETGEVEEGEMFGLSDERWGIRQRHLADRIFQKRLEIEVLFREIATIEAMMAE